MATPNNLLTHLRTHTCALFLPRGGTLRWSDMAVHRAAHERDPEYYALLALLPGVQPWQRARVLLQVLSRSQAGLDDATRSTLARVSGILLLGLPPAHVITVLLALRRLRANHKHTTRAVLRFVLEHPDADTLIATRRPALVDCFEHALGKSTARECARRAAAHDPGSDYLRRRLLRFLTEPDTALCRVRALYAGEEPGRRSGPGMPGGRPHGAAGVPPAPLHLDAVASGGPAVPPDAFGHPVGLATGGAFDVDGGADPDRDGDGAGPPTKAALLSRLAMAERLAGVVPDGRLAGAAPDGRSGKPGRLGRGDA